jgi:hypothetical protein
MPSPLVTTMRVIWCLVVLDGALDLQVLRRR